MRFKTVRLMVIRNGSKRTIFANDELGLLQMVLELDIGRYANEDVGLPRGWIVRSHISWRRERNIPYKGVEIST